MFTGLVEATSEFLALEKAQGGGRFHVATPESFMDLIQGESIAVNGCCLTLVGSDEETLRFDLLDETLVRTNLGALEEHALVNLERAMPANGRLGGHFVQGHVDCVGEILAIEPHGADRKLVISLPKTFAQYVVFKGSIAVDGISLTVAEIGADSFTLWIIPHTQEVTNLSDRRVGDQVNLEFDLVAKYIERMLAVRGEP